LAKRVAIECNDSASNNASAITDSVVGYATRLEGEDITSQQHIHYVTDDYFLHKTILQDPFLSKYSVVIVDDAHLRTVLTDITLATLKALQRNKRTNLRIVICSATRTDAQSIIDYFYLSTEESTTSSHCSSTSNTIISLSAWRESYPVEEFFVDQPITDYIQTAVSTAIQIHFEESLQRTASSTSDSTPTSSSSLFSGGDILCFLPSVEDIDVAIRLGEEMYQQTLQLQQPEQRQSKKKRPKTMQLVFLPLHSQLPSHLQARIVQPHATTGGKADFDHRRVLMATDIAETTVSVPNVTHVIDSGKVQLPFFDTHVQQQRQVVRPVSMASAQQRRLCAAMPIGPTRAQVQCGKVYRLYTEKDYFTLLPKTTQPEIQRSNLFSFVLTVKSFGIDNMLQFDWITPPSVSALMYALSTLYGLGAISSSLSDYDGDPNAVPITPLGKQLNEFPVDPFHAKVLLSSLTLDCVDEIVTIVSLAQVPNSSGILRRPRNITNTRQQQADYNALLNDMVDYSGDHMTYVNAMALANGKNEGECDECFLNYGTVARARVIRRQLHQFLRYISNKYYNGWKRSRPRDANENNNDDDDRDLSERVRKCIVSGFFYNVARLKGDGQYYSVRYGNRIRLSPNSILSQYHYNYYFGGGRRDSNKEYIVYNETFENGTIGDDVEARSCSIVDARWLKELTPIYWM
jgi:ATP-dependent RNA helicase DDX35